MSLELKKRKDELEEIIAFLRDPKKFTKLGGRIPKGVLLIGAPGTGKNSPRTGRLRVKPMSPSSVLVVLISLRCLWELGPQG